MSFSSSENRAFDLAEKITSVISVVGAAFIIVTFLFDDRFRKAINRLVFYACWGNLFANVATLISRSGINLGVNSPLFLPADALWTFAMACNVYLSFFRRYDAPRLRTLEWRYLACCYGIPFVPALVFLFIRTPVRGKIYGNAVLWCWVSEEWNALRIATFYGPVWLVILMTFFIYLKVGMVVFRWRKQQLRSFDHNSSANIDKSGRDYPMGDMARRKYESTDNSASTGYTHHRSPSVEENTVGALPPTVHVTQSSQQVVDANRATLSYCNTAMLFFVALICTWVPSTVNRFYTLVHPNDPKFGLEFSSGLVLPLQGCWNTVIYIVTSLPACKALWADLFGQSPRDDPGSYIRSPPLTLTRSNHQTLPSHDQRADIMMSFDGKKRVIRHDSRAQSRDGDIAHGIIGQAA
ncbi:hypothetical protein EDD36DRAFT_465460 [Exophiala viscosa]|uniref:G-protein coupled receptors family 2 profile 2 domain-containing protein n=1 Tax=Exophiala viscosa TaxID=2486360 RepID=A0AAN6IDR3_9EURO|nr:hypothetical protein EDD36DRAFT_465460 [Exophiala viscosa]